MRLYCEYQDEHIGNEETVVLGYSSVCDKRILFYGMVNPLCIGQVISRHAAFGSSSIAGDRVDSFFHFCLVFCPVKDSRYNVKTWLIIMEKRLVG